MAWIADQAELQFSRSSGPGGQNVNKLNTRVTLSIPLAEIPGIDEDQLRRLHLRLGNRISAGDILQIHSQESRSQGRNREIAVERAAGLIADALQQRRKRVPTRPSAGAKRRRISGKKQRGEIKRNRKPPSADDI